jgi:hypothetical protein
MHIKALFTMDHQSKLVTINEPWDASKMAPRLYIGKTFDGFVVYKFRYDVALKIIKNLEEYLRKEPPLNKDTEIKYRNEYLKILKSEDYFDEICYHYKIITNGIGGNCVKITAENITNYNLGDFEWLNDEIKYGQPCYGIIKEGQIVSICRSVRITKEAHEAGIETIGSFRGNGYAEIVLKHWAKEVQGEECIPLYSTGKRNKSSQRVAEKAGLSTYGIGLSIK